jgi:ABC-2 type transport system permease protein
VLLLAVLLTWSGTLLCLGALLGVLVRSVGALSASYDIGGMLLSSMGGALVPLAVLPHWVRSVAPASPGYWAASSMQSAFAGDLHGVLLGTLVLAAVAVICSSIASLRLRSASSRLAAL